MIFKKLHEARDWFLNHKEFEFKIIDFWTEYNHRDWKFGDYILFQHIKDHEDPHPYGKVSRPILGIFVSFTIWDQALVLNFVQNRRAWTRHHDVVTNSELDISMSIFSLDDEVESIQFWTDNIHVLDHWKNRPNFNELKLALAHKLVSREDKLNDIIGDT